MDSSLLVNTSKMIKWEHVEFASWITVPILIICIPPSLYNLWLTLLIVKFLNPFIQTLSNRKIFASSSFKIYTFLKKKWKVVFRETLKEMWLVNFRWRLFYKYSSVCYIIYSPLPAFTQSVYETWSSTT